MWGHSGKPAICEPRREASKETNPDDTLTLDLQPPELLFKDPTPRLWHFVMAAGANYTVITCSVGRVLSRSRTVP